MYEQYISSWITYRANIISSNISAEYQEAKEGKLSMYQVAQDLIVDRKTQGKTVLLILNMLNFLIDNPTRGCAYVVPPATQEYNANEVKKVLNKYLGSQELTNLLLKDKIAIVSQNQIHKLRSWGIKEQFWDLRLLRLKLLTESNLNFV